MSSKEETVIVIKNLFNGKDLKLKISRGEFEEMIADKLKQTIDMVHEAVDNAKRLKDGIKNIQEIVLVGGSSRIPKIKQLLSEAFGSAKIHSSANPDSIVAIGAGIQAALLIGNHSSQISNILLFDVLPLSLGVRASGGEMSVIIPRNTQVPRKKGKYYGTKNDNQRSVIIAVYEGENKFVANNNQL